MAAPFLFSLKTPHLWSMNHFNMLIMFSSFILILRKTWAVIDSSYDYYFSFDIFFRIINRNLTNLGVFHLWYSQVSLEQTRAILFCLTDQIISRNSPGTIMKRKHKTIRNDLYIIFLALYWIKLTYVFALSSFFLFSKGQFYEGKKIHRKQQKKMKYFN